MKTHKFDVEDAEKYGIYKAILLEHLKFHQQANEGNPDLTFEGKTYAFIKKETVENMYSYMNYDSVRKWLKELEDEKVIESLKPHAKRGYHLKYYHVLSVPTASQSNGITSQSNETTSHSMNETTSHSSILPYMNNTYVEKGTNIVEKIKNASTIQELYQVYGHYRRRKFKSFPDLSEVELIQHTWNQYPLHEVKSAVALTISKGWKNIPWESWDTLKQGAENFNIKGVAWAKENGFMSIEEAKIHAKKNYNQPLNELSGCYIIREFEGKELVKHV